MFPHYLCFILSKISMRYLKRFYRAILKNPRNEKPSFVIKICANFKKTFTKNERISTKIIILVVSLTPGLWDEVGPPKKTVTSFKSPKQQIKTLYTISACLRSFLANNSITAFASALRLFARACLTPSVDIQYGPITMLDGREFSRVSLSFKCLSISCFTSDAERSWESYSLKTAGPRRILDLKM